MTRRLTLRSSGQPKAGCACFRRPLSSNVPVHASSMTITPAATELIRDRLARSNIQNPVVSLVQMSNCPEELEQARRRGAPRSELRAIASRTLNSEPKWLYAGIYPRSWFLWIFAKNIGGFRFVSPWFYPGAAREAMKTGTLDISEQGLVLRNASGIVVLPMQS